MSKKYVKMLYKSPIGPLSLVADDHYLFGIWIEEESDFEKGLSENDVTIVESHPILTQITSYLETYFKGQDQDLSGLSLAPVGSDFEKRVWNYLRGIPFGQTVTYGQIADVYKRQDLMCITLGLEKATQFLKLSKIWKKLLDAQFHTVSLNAVLVISQLATQTQQKLRKN